MSAAANLLSRAANLLPDEEPSKSGVLLLAGNALHETGAFDAAIASYEASASLASIAGRPAAVIAANTERLRSEYLTGRLDDAEFVAGEVARAFVELGALGDADGLSRVWQLQLNLDLATCQWAAAHRAATSVIECAGRAGNSTLEVRTMPLLAFLAQKGPTPVDVAVRECTEILDRVASDRRSSSLTRLELSMLSAMALDFAAARAAYSETRSVLDELGWEMQAALVSLSSGPIELLADDPVRAETELRRDFDALEAMGERNFISLTAGLLADAVYRQRRFEEAQTLVELSREIAAPDDLAVQIVWRGVAGKLAARSRDHDSAFALVREACALIDSTEDPSGQADLLVDLAEVLALAGDRSAAVAVLADARVRYATKGNQAGVARVERAIERLAKGIDPLG
jgi:tetratricopeptide (TPR) repeat protein